MTMSFVIAANSNCIRLWLFVTLIGFCTSQDFSSNASRGDLYFPTCSEGKFECQNKECIESELLCDGRPDCLDSSDETEFECSKPEFTCPDYAFRCKYGACIDQDLVCNGWNDCIADGSDENFEGICYKQLPPPGLTSPNYTGGVPSNGYPGVSGFGGAFDQPLYPSTVNLNCPLPPRPKNGQFKLRRISETDDIEYIDPPSSELEANSSLVYTCDPGYKIRGNPLVSCSPLGQLSRKPVCIEVRCRPLASESTMGTCIYASGRRKPCGTTVPVRPATRAEPSCRPGYRTEFLLPGPQIVECNKDGKWEPEPIRCVPVCGVVDFHTEALVPGGTSANSSAFPWHAALYVQENSLNGAESVFRCDATVIQANLLLTTAQCVSDFITSWNPADSMSTKPLEVLESFSIRTRNTDHHSLPHDPQLIGKHRVKNVHTTCNIHSMTSIRSTEIALIELYEPLQFSDTLLPACLDEIGAIQQILEASSHERISRSRGSPTNGNILRTYTTVLNSPYTQCVTLYNATRSPFRINDEKFCFTYDNGTSSCVLEVVNDGGGLVFEVNNLWYLMGIVSHIFTLDTDSGERLCGRDSKMLYNKVSKQMTWIQQVISNLERSKYPPCSRYLPPFHTKPTTPEPIPITMMMTDSTPTPTSSTVQSNVGSRLKADSCLAPQRPINGQLRLHEDFCENDFDCSPTEGTILGLGSQLVYSCDPGYRLDGNADVYCKANGNWSTAPICIEIKCIPLKSMSMAVTCSRFGEWVDCNFPVFPDTQAKISCRSGYRAQMTQKDIIECKMNGIWEPDTVPQCAPVCGATFGRSQLFEAGEITGPAYPWHATVYTQEDTSMEGIKKVRCGATLIQSNLLLTAAHCVYDEINRTTEDPRKLFILMSNIHRHYDSPLHDFHSVRRGIVKNVHLHCNYHGLRGNYEADIALLELEEPFEFFNVQLHPACLDFSGYNARVLGPGASGELIGFGKTAIGEPSNVLQTISVPYVSQDECKNSNIALEKQVLISNDKFCAGYTNGTAICLGEGGGGLFLQINGLWFVMGVVSVDLNVDSNDGKSTCGGNAHMLYTRVSDYMAWILDVMFHLERYKSYPPCNADPI